MNNEDLNGLAAREAVIINKDKGKRTRAGKYNQIRVHNICTHISNGNTLLERQHLRRGSVKARFTGGEKSIKSLINW